MGGYLELSWRIYSYSCGTNKQFTPFFLLSSRLSGTLVLENSLHPVAHSATIQHCRNIILACLSVNWMGKRFSMRKAYLSRALRSTLGIGLCIGELYPSA